MTGKGRELADMMERRKVDILCVQETRWKGSKARSIGGGYKLFYSTVQCDGECGKEVKRRVQAGWSGWRKVSGVLCDRRVSARIKGKVYRTVVRAAMMYGLETVAVRKRQEAEMEVAEMRMFSLGVTRMDKIRNEHIRGTAQKDVGDGDSRQEVKRKAKDKIYGCAERGQGS
ncbi:hypothetical protein DNTS_023788 [Danionella cerebrum]|uniref:Endonuclease/exonuclease/phosphatase domain-containing protein n=1 Tax=Danionella cerebrum TaxID=2873325 RepID=A0A553QV82_9TELE|nr:hypothetical protein DNTS_023788 [Danionella translucida]